MSSRSDPAGARRVWLPVLALGLGVVGLGGAAWWWLSSGQELATLRDHVGVVRVVAYSADGATLYSAGDDGGVRVWDTQSHRLRRTIEGPGGKITALALSSK